MAETFRQPNKTDIKIVVFWRTYPVLICIKHNGDDASKVNREKNNGQKLGEF